MANGTPDQPANAPTPTPAQSQMAAPGTPAKAAPAGQDAAAQSAPARPAETAAEAVTQAPDDTAAQADSDAPQNPAGAGRPGSSVVAAPVQDDEAQAEWPRYKVEPPASGFRWHGLDVGSDFTPVPPDRTGPLLSAAAAVGVTLTAEG